MKKLEEIIKELGANTELSAIDFRVQSISEKGYCTVLGRDLYDLPKISFMLAPNEFNVQQSGQKKIGRPTFDFVLAKWQWSYNDKGTLFAKDNHNRIRYNSSKDYNALPK